ncbi:mechanosensitive ion channel family protein [Nocardioides sp. Kera G14]|uniref:mechanosensitive ion channel family protein n=1 Tax=Nocardioides sp. Kera G14 TaxID=2884264 RepID=UPI001D11B13B|nr:mechanosensitive ion channel domain-containing protein [Nocardioides sp. Kera G14]UDY25368.1 mechanosensitive ion channel family protein [Nocardioides sp. Kera G14]
MDFFQALVAAFATAAVVGLLGYLLFRWLCRHWTGGPRLNEAARHPYRALLVTVAAVVAARTAPADTAAWWPLLQRGLRIALILVLAWFVAAVLVYLEDGSLNRHRTDIPDNLAARRMRTQVLLLRRLTVAVVVIVAICSILMTFPAVRSVGASLFASAGILSVIVGLAAQSTLSNVFAGITLAFSDALRIDDAVIVEDEWGWIEEVTLTYVVVRLWDDRRLILPSTYFSQNPFQNWTRHTSELLGSVEFDVDWRVDTDGMRLELSRVLAGTDLWDGRVQVLQVTDTIGAMVRIRILVTAHDAPTLFDLRCLVRERMVSWMQRHNPDGLPRSRMELVESEARVYRRLTTETEGLFTGGPEAESRAARAGGSEPPPD